MIKNAILIAEPEDAYELIDSGDGEKLERYGPFLLSRPDPQALWKKHAPEEWAKAHGVFTRDGKSASWEMKLDVPVEWTIELNGFHFVVSPTAFKHTGIFPEQINNWNWISDTVSRAKSKSADPITVLNLFGYTGGATLAAAKAGAEVTHVDGSKAAINWAKENAKVSGLEDKPIRWMLDDVRKFVAREIKRGKKYDGIILDPPVFGHGPNSELWKIEEHLQELLFMCRQVMSNNPLFIMMSGYASGYSGIAYGNNIDDLMSGFGGETEMGELTIRESSKKSGGGRLLPCGIFARWRREYY